MPLVPGGLERNRLYAHSVACAPCLWASTWIVKCFIPSMFRWSSLVAVGRHTWLILPYIKPTIQWRWQFNIVLSSDRSVMEWTFGLLEMCFRCLVRWHITRQHSKKQCLLRGMSCFAQYCHGSWIATHVRGHICCKGRPNGMYQQQQLTAGQATHIKGGTS